MSRYARFGELAKAGAVDSKYFRNLDKFEEDVARKIEATNKFQETIRALILENPSLIERRYFNTIEVLKELKEEFGI